MLAQTTVQVLRNQLLSKDTHEIVLEAPQEFSFKAGQYCTFHVPYTHEHLGPSKKIKHYSIASSPDELPELRVCIKRVGVGSNNFCDLESGELVMQGPMGRFVLQEQKHDAIFLAAGTGIAPIHSMIQYGVKHKLFKSIILIQGARKQENMLYSDGFYRLPITYYQATSQEGDKEYVQDILQKLFEQKLINPDVHVYICGLADMVEACKQVCQDLGLKQLHYERFT